MNVLNSLLEKVPWFPTALAWALALIILWLIVSFPAHLTVPIVRAVRLRITAWLKGFTSDLKAAAAKRADRQHSADVKLCETRLLWMPRLSSEIGASRRSLDRIERQIGRTQEKLAALSVATPAFPEIPSPEQGISESASSRLAWLNVVIGGFLLVALMVVNTGMLSQILRELAIVPASLRFGSLPLYFVFAFLLTLVEAGIGFLHGALTHTNNTEGPKPLKLSGLGTLVAAMAIAFVEGFFYSQVGDPKRVFALTEWLTARHDQIFFIWGAVLVMLLFGLGHVLIRSAQTIRSASAAAHFRRQLKRFASDISGAKDLFRETEEQLRAAVVEAGGAAEGIRKTGFTEPGKPAVSLTSADLQAVRSRTTAWLVFALAGLLVLALISSMTAIPYWIGFGTGVACFVVGVLLRKEDGAVQTGDTLTIVATWDWIRTGIAALVLVGVVALHAYLFGELSASADVVGWLLSLAVCALLIGAGREAAGAFGLFGVSMHAVLSAILALLSLPVIAVVAIVVLLVWVVETALVILAAPVSWFRRAEPPAAIAEDAGAEIRHAVVE